VKLEWEVLDGRSVFRCREVLSDYRVGRFSVSLNVRQKRRRWQASVRVFDNDGGDVDCLKVYEGTFDTREQGTEAAENALFRFASFISMFACVA
jgi:hypothetical protein